MYMRTGSPILQCSVLLGGKSPHELQKTGFGCYQGISRGLVYSLRDKERLGELLNEKTLRHAANQFQREYEVLTVFSPT